MTPSEFKQQYPHLSHLEGEDLWNAMEDSLRTSSSIKGKTREALFNTGSVYKVGEPKSDHEDNKVLWHVGNMYPTSISRTPSSLDDELSTVCDESKERPDTWIDKRFAQIWSENRLNDMIREPRIQAIINGWDMPLHWQYFLRSDNRRSIWHYKNGEDSIVNPFKYKFGSVCEELFGECGDVYLNPKTSDATHGFYNAQVLKYSNQPK